MITDREASMQSKKKLFLSGFLGIVLGILLSVLALNYFIGNATGSVAGTLKILWTLNILHSKYVEPVNTKNLVDTTIKNLVASVGDPHTTYMSGELFKNFMSETKGEFSGIGVVVGQKDGFLTVVAPVEGSPGDLAGVKVGEKILKIDGKEIKDLSLEEAVGKIRGPKGTKVILTLQAEDATIRDVEIVRDVIKTKTVAGKMLEKDIGYIRISMFSENTAQDFAVKLDELDKLGMKKLVLDLRSNPGGLLDSCVKIANNLIPKGLIVSVVDKDGNKQEYLSKLEQQKYKLVVLVDKGSASASEIVAGAVKDSKAGTIVGQTTYGKGSVQTIMPLDYESAIKVTIANYYTPAGTSINGVGVQPDVVVELKSVADEQLQKALEIIRTK